MRWGQVNIIHLASMWQKRLESLLCDYKDHRPSLREHHLRCLLSPSCLKQWTCRLHEPLTGDGEARTLHPISCSKRAHSCSSMSNFHPSLQEWGHTMRKLTPRWLACKEFGLFSVPHRQALTTVCLAFLRHTRQQVAMPLHGRYGIWPWCYWTGWGVHIDEPPSFHKDRSLLRLG